MDAASFSKEIRTAWKLLHERLGTGRTCLWPASLPVSEEFRKVALDPQSTYAQIYRRGLTLSHYNLLLSDYSYFQFSFENSKSWRLGYFPNPWTSGVESALAQVRKWEELEASGELSSEDVSMLMDDLEYQGAIPAIRFEFAENQYREIAHPAAHFHIGRDVSNRWPSALAVGPLVFTSLVSKLYYSREWSPLSAFDTPDVQDCLDQFLISAAGEAVVVHAFTDAERRSPHFGRNLVALPPAAPKQRQGRARKVAPR